MGSIYCKQWIEDLDLVIKNCPELSELKGKTIMITGATGLICSAIIDILIRYNQSVDDKIHIIAAGRSEDGMRERFDKYFYDDYFTYMKYDSTKENSFNFECDYIIHGASNAFPKSISEQPVETMISNIIGIRDILEYVRNSQVSKRSVKRVIYISSSEVYGNKSDNNPFVEDEYGIVDILNPRNSYSESKRAAETLCISYAEEYGLDTVIVRPGHIYGPTASRGDNRVSSMWAYDVAEGKNIVMKSDGSQLRSYTYCLDCASAILKVLLDGESNNSYNISNQNSVISIKEMAEILAKVGEVKLIIATPDETEKKSYNPMINSSLNSQKLMSLGWQGVFEAREGFEHTVKIIRSFS